MTNPVLELIQTLSPDEREQFTHDMLSFLYDAQDYRPIFELIDVGQFLTAKVEITGSYQLIIRDLKTYAIPAAVNAGDHERFLTYSLLATNLDALSSKLENPSILHSLVHSGYWSIAKDAVVRIADPHGSARRHASIIAIAPEDVHVLGEMQALTDRLREASLPQNQAQAAHWADTLTAIIRALGERVEFFITPFVEALAAWPIEQSAVWAEFACVSQGERQWAYLSNIPDPDWLSTHIRDILTAQHLDDPHEQLSCLCAFSGGSETFFWAAAFPILAAMDEEATRTLWPKLRKSHPIPWTADLIENAADFIAVLDEAEQQSIVSELDPLSLAAMHVLLLEIDDDIVTIIDRIPSAEDKLHWSVRLLDTESGISPSVAQRVLMNVAAWLRNVNYHVSSRDIARFINAVGRITPGRLAIHLEHILHTAPAPGDLILYLARNVEDLDTLAYIFEHAERLAGIVADQGLRGFQLREQLLIESSTRIDIIQQTDNAIKQAEERLLPGECDNLYTVAAQKSAEVGRLDLAQQLVNRIASDAKRHTARLAIAVDRSVVVDFNQLYAAYAEIEPLDDELWVLAALLDDPNRPEEIADTAISSISSHSRQAYAYLDLAVHNATYQRAAHAKDTTLLDFELPTLFVQRAVSRIESNEQLLDLTLEIVRLASLLGSKRSAAEFYDAIQKTLLFEDSPWISRLTTIHKLMAQSDAILLPDELLESNLGKNALKDAAEFVNRVLQLPENPVLDDVKSELQADWHRILPAIMAAYERMPQGVRYFVEFPFLTRLLADFYETINRTVGWDRLLTSLNILTVGPLSTISNLFRPKWLRDRGLHWDWLTETQLACVDLCFADRMTREEKARQLLNEGTGHSPIAETLVILLINDYPLLALDLLEHLPRGDSLDELCLRLVDAVPLNGIFYSRLQDITEEQTSQELHIHQILHADSDWVFDWEVRGQIEYLVRSGNCDAESQTTRMLLKRLWHATNETSPPSPVTEPASELIRQAVDAEQEFDGLKVWLNTLIYPQLGKKHDAQAAHIPTIRKAIHRAKSLEKPPPQEQQESTTLSEEDEKKRLTGIYRRWLNTPRQDWWWGDNAAEGLAQNAWMFVLMTAILVLSFDAMMIPMWREGLASFGPFTNRDIVLAALFFLIYFSNAWLVDSYLGRKTPHQYRYQRWLLTLRLILSGFPIANLIVISGWQWIVEEQPDWALSQRDMQLCPPLSLQNPQGGAAFGLRMRLNRLSQRVWPFYGLWVLLLGSFGIMVFTLWRYVYVAPINTLHLVLLNIIGIIIHMVMAGLLLLAHQYQRRSQGNVTFRLYPVLILLVMSLIPYPLLSLLGIFIFIMMTNTDDTLIASAFKARDAIGRSPLWADLEETLRRSWKKTGFFKQPVRPGNLEQTVDPTQTEKRVYRLYLVKNLALIGEAAWFMWALIWLTERWPALEGVLAIMLQIVFYGSLILGAIGLLLMVASYVQRLFRTETILRLLEKYPYAASLFAGTQLAVAAGIIIVFAFWQDEPIMVGGVLAFAGLIIGLSNLLPSMLGVIFPVPDNPSFSLKPGYVWSIVWVLIAVIGLSITQEHELYELQLELVRFNLNLLPLGTVFAFVQLKWLLRPYTIHDRRNSALSLYKRRFITFMEVTVALPFGGVFIPVWIYMRERLLHDEATNTTDNQEG